MLNLIWIALVGILGGLLGGMGFGGGTVLIPLLVGFFGLNQHLAQALNIISFIPMAFIALFIHYKNGYLKIKSVVVYIALIVVSAFAFSFLAPLINGKLLTKLFGGFLIFLAIFMFFFKNKNKKEGQATKKKAEKIEG